MTPLANFEQKMIGVDLRLSYQNNIKQNDVSPTYQVYRKLIGNIDRCTERYLEIQIDRYSLLTGDFQFILADADFQIDRYLELQIDRQTLDRPQFILVDIIDRQIPSRTFQFILVDIIDRQISSRDFSSYQQKVNGCIKHIKYTLIDKDMYFEK